LDLSTAAQLEGPLEEAVASPSAAVLIDLEVTGLEHSLRVFPTRDEAVAALRG
jgi:hypothetical protein